MGMSVRTDSVTTDLGGQRQVNIVLYLSKEGLEPGGAGIRRVYYERHSTRLVRQDQGVLLWLWLGDADIEA